MKGLRHVVLAGAAALVLVQSLGAQALDPRLARRLDARTGASVSALVDSARVFALPTEPLIDKALEGAAKRATGTRIVVAVRVLMLELLAARGALGADARHEDVAAAADALHAGARADALGRLRSMRRSGPLTIPLAVLADLIARGVPADTASAAVLALARAGAADAEFIALRHDVERDISAGAPPAIAASLRARGGPPPPTPVSADNNAGTARAPRP